MLGDEDVYDALAYEDEAFQRLFKVKADFDVTIPRQSQTVMQYAGFLSVSVLRSTCVPVIVMPSPPSLSGAYAWPGVKISSVRAWKPSRTSCAKRITGPARLEHPW